MRIELSRQTLTFKKPARTSRGEYAEHEMVIVKATDGEGRVGVGECAPLPDLSCDRNAYGSLDDVRTLLSHFTGSEADYEALRDYPALLFAVESAVGEMSRVPYLYDTPFARGEEGIPINGLVWMAPYDDMLQQIRKKLETGFHCVKLKIGAIGWDDEVALIKYIRSRFSVSDLQLRVDANGAFSPDDAMGRLEELARYDIHSIEQPIRQGQWEAMARLCRETPLPIVLDEELIGLNRLEEKRTMLDEVRPQYIVLKPTLHGGMMGTREWVAEAVKRGVGSWITSALESNIGLKNVALLAASIYGSGISFPQGLGTGQLFVSNIDNGVRIEGEKLWFSTAKD